MVSVPRGLPLKHVPTVFHIGTLDPSQRRTLSYEGPGLSVTTADAVDDWRRIARLGANPVHRLRGGLFLHATAMTGPQWRFVENWGVDQGLVRRERAWQAHTTDEEGDRWSSVHPSFADALSETHEYDPDERRIRPTKHTVPLDKGARGMHGREYALLKFAEATGKRGVWWSDINNGAMSAPRGSLIL